CQLTPTVAAAPVHPRHGLGHAVVALYARHGGGVDGPCLALARSPALSHPAVAPASRGVSTPRWWEAVRKAGLRRRRASAQPVARASPGERERLRCHDGLMDGPFLLR